MKAVRCPYHHIFDIWAQNSPQDQIRLISGEYILPGSTYKYAGENCMSAVSLSGKQRQNLNVGQYLVQSDWVRPWDSCFDVLRFGYHSGTDDMFCFMMFSKPRLYFQLNCITTRL